MLVSMALLDVLFPGLNIGRYEGLPVWEDGNRPWEILSSGQSGIMSQILGLEDSVDGVFIHPTAEIGDFVEIEGPCYIGKNCEIRHSAFLRKGSWICEDSVVGHSSEIKNSILLPGSKAPHFNYVGDSILGFGVNLGAGTKLSNVRNDRGLVKVTMRDGSKVETGLKKMGSLIGNYAQLGCNVVTNPGSIMEPKVMVSPNVTVSGWLEARS